MATQETRTPIVVHGVGLSRILLFVGAVLFFIAAIVADGTSVLSTPMWAWAFWGFCAWLMSGVV